MSNEVYQHGIYSEELETIMETPDVIESAIGVVIGTAPIHLAEDPYHVTNLPILVNNLEEAKRKLGYSTDFENYTLCQSMYARFVSFKIAPVIFINVLDPFIHKKEVTDKAFDIVEKKIVLEDDGILLDKVNISSVADDTKYQKGIDYVISFNSDGNVVVSITENGAITSQQVKIGYTKLDVSLVKSEDIIGGLDAETGIKKGVSCVNQVFNKLAKVPCQLLSPGWSHIPEVGSVLIQQAKIISGLFTAIAITDLDTNAIRNLDEIKEYKEQYGYDDAYNLVCYPKAIVNKHKVYLSAMVDAVLANTDNIKGGPYVSPSNKKIGITGLCTGAGQEIEYDIDEANKINAAGVMTALNFQGWRAWGNEMGCYPQNKDIKDHFIVCRRVFNYRDNVFKLDFFNRVDDPTNFRLVEDVVAAENKRLAALSSAGLIAGGELSYNVNENPEDKLLAGHIIFRKTLSPFTPAMSISTKISFDPTLNIKAFGGEK